MRLLANFEAHDFRAIFQTGLDLRTQLGQRFLAGGAPGAGGERFIAPRSVAVAFDAFHENWNLHDKPAYFNRRLYSQQSPARRRTKSARALSIPFKKLAAAFAGALCAPWSGSRPAHS
jgi:hypothetical protein